jgi:hypothetical protein
VPIKSGQGKTSLVSGKPHGTLGRIMYYPHGFGKPRTWT